MQILDKGIIIFKIKEFYLYSHPHTFMIKYVISFFFCLPENRKKNYLSLEHQEKLIDIHFFYIKSLNEKLFTFP